MHWDCGVIEQSVMGEEENEKRMLDKIGSILMLRKSMAERNMTLFGHIVRTTAWKSLTKAKMEASDEGADMQRHGSRIRKNGICSFLCSMWT